MTNDLLYQLALTLVPHIGSVHARILSQHFGSAELIFKASESQLEKIEGIGAVRAKSIRNFKDFKIAAKEISFIEQYKIQPLFLTDPSYPQRLLNCYDPPTLLFYRGKANLNTSRIIAVIGTRNYSDYGKQVTEKLIKDLSDQHVMIVSGLAFGIDAIGHKAAIKNNLPTVAVLGHGLDQVYPPEHTNLAKDVIKSGGGLLTEFWSNTKPDKHNFPARNRIVAGMVDAVIVIESGIKGGSMVTAELANSYNKDVFAYPGKVTDSKSGGCHQLIRNNKAVLLTSAEELVEELGWNESKPINGKKQKELFVELSSEEKTIVDILNEKEAAHIDELNLRSGLSNSTVAAAVLSLELQNIIESLPGKIYKMI